MHNSHISVLGTTYKISKPCFESSNNYLDTGYRSKIYTNTSTVSVGSLTIAFSNVTLNSSSITNNDYSFSWYYFQTNVFSNTSTVNNQSNKFTININEDGYLNNYTAIIWRLVINSTLNGKLGVCVSSFELGSAVVDLGLTRVEPDVIANQDTPDEFDDYKFAAGFLVFISLVILIQRRKK